MTTLTIILIITLYVFVRPYLYLVFYGWVYVHLLKRRINPHFRQIFIFNRFVPFKGVIALNILPFVLLVRRDVYEKEINYYGSARAKEKLLQHERIHTLQQLELGIVLFYLLYAFFTLCYGYRQNPFEREAYYYGDLNRYNYGGIMHRRTKFEFLKYL